jgi:DNA-binding IclR family transcriptional regulator
MPSPTDCASTARTATGRVLYATQTDCNANLPDCWSPREWQRIRQSIRDLNAAVVDDQEAFPGMSCVSAPVWSPDGACIAAVTALLGPSRPTSRVHDLVVQSARRISMRLK